MFCYIFILCSFHYFILLLYYHIRIDTILLCILQQPLYWEITGFKRGPGRLRANWRGVVKKDLHQQRMGLTWEEAEVAALDRQEWRRNVAQCVHVDAG